MNSYIAVDDELRDLDDEDLLALIGAFSRKRELLAKKAKFAADMAASFSNELITRKLRAKHISIGSIVENTAHGMASLDLGAVQMDNKEFAIVDIKDGKIWLRTFSSAKQKVVGKAVGLHHSIIDTFGKEVGEIE